MVDILNHVDSGDYVFQLCSENLLKIIFPSYVYMTDKGTSSLSTNNGVLLEEVLEEAPKWKVLRVSE